ncbi:laminin subunit alpha-1 [Gracilinanus agilis]|uniref:laminin subunit alpha-1 n=1 Tax=Gracilinanus agilis TaxID=191870 RepID=UPI001CFD8523|nr:laminin subunit alpha-1 [Gracilinanus agilis]
MLRCCGQGLLVAALLLWTTGQCQQRGLFPSILNLAANAVINSNATCGDDGPEMFCKLVEHVPGQLIRNAQCRICDKNSLNPKERHPISNAIDGTNNWWQSPSIQNGREFHRVTVTLDLRQVFQVAYIIIKAANSPRPGNWILERSIDGIHFSPWQYYAISDTDCLVQYNITPRLGPPTYKKDDEVICTSYYSKLVPLEHGEIHTSLINGRPGADDLSPTLLNFTSARFVRLSFQKIRTLNADLMTLSRRDPKDLDPIVTRRYYYSIKDISIGGMCICYGHANSCPLDATKKKLICKCEHNTCGDSCDKCCPGFHQQLWKPGTISSGNTCEECNCHNKTKDCYYDQSVADQKKSMNIAGEFKGGGVCINCQQNTAGINCETCADGYYRPHTVSPRDEYPCRPCNCDPWGSLSSVCTKEDGLQNDGNLAGQCQCKEGYIGQQCDRCQFGYKGYPLCSQCTCNEAGSVSDLCDEPCLCKENVEGDRCDVCKAGSFNLNKDNPEGCTECFCFGVSDVCDSLFWPVSEVTEMLGWLVTFTPKTKNAPSQQDHSDRPDQFSTNDIENIEVPESEEYYWSAPLAYLGNKLTAFGRNLKYAMSSDDPEKIEDDTPLVSHAHVIIKGNGITISTKTKGIVKLFEKNLNVVKLVPENFRDHNTKKEIDRDKLMTVLANVTQLLIKANVNKVKKALNRLISVTLETANPNAINPELARDAEHCECPQGYTGISCESCLPGYYRVGGILFGGICQPCECNDHASDCDIHGACIDCKDNTTGDNCDQCLPGFYGNPSQGTPKDCQPCKCPLSSSSNNFSPTCSLNNENEVICDKCQMGYTGNQCERCADGYYGNPTVSGEFCIPCDCNDNVDPLEADNCDTFTGECLKCIGNTGGPHCEWCADGYHGDAVVAKNCSVCSCHETGSVSNICNHETGVCNCKPNVIGQHCDQCANGYFDLKTGAGCQPCNCHKSGSVSENCNDEGQCQCVPGVAGQKCDQCARGFYEYQDGSCTPCDCEHTQNSCDSKSGECICPPNTKGFQCEDCEDEHWGRDPDVGCKPCNCSNEGSTSRQCDLESGQCLCKKEYTGKKCNECAFGFRDYPDCVPCNCEASGTREDTCDGEVCSCEKRTGICTCKENVFGLHCSECKMGTFALHDENPLGCSPCFCFGMTRFCSELEGYIRIPITIIDEEKILRVVSQDTLEGTTEGVYYQSPDVVLDVFTVREYIKAETLYWELPDEFLGDQLMAYGGKLKYIVTFYSLNGTGSSNWEPQIIIKGGHTNKFTIYANITTPKNGVRTYHEVDMIENYWKYFNSASEKYVIRSHFMLVLSNIDYILIKASHGQALLQSRIANISLEIGIKAEEGKYYSEEEIAYYLENCQCPPGTAGFSCQDCASGYYRAKFLKVSGDDPLPLVASCVPCECNNHSETCHPETGQCLNCRDNTAGNHCDICAPGYYGKVRGSANDCSVCECPRSDASFSPTCHLVDENDFRCDACSPGYEGPYCEKCGSGYYGNPFMIGGSCQACDCDPNGSVHNLCNTTSGQCICKPEFSGLACDKCKQRHVLVDLQCVSCDDECVGELLNVLDNVTDAISHMNFTGIIQVPYEILYNLENTTRNLRLSIRNNKKLVSLERANKQVEDMSEDLHHFEKELTEIVESSQYLNGVAEDIINKTQDLATLIQRVKTTINVIVEEAQVLNETNSIQLPDATLQNMHEDIASMLETVQKRNLTQLYQNATNELKASKNLLSLIQKDFQKPLQYLENLKEKTNKHFADYINKLKEAQAFVDDANAKTKEANSLLQISAINLEKVNEKKLHVLEKLNSSLVFIEKGKKLLALIADFAKDAKNTTEMLELQQDELVFWSAKIRHHVDELVMQMARRGALDLVYRAEDHAAELIRLADVLDRGLTDVKDISLNATTAVHAHSSIQSFIEDAKNLVEEALRKTEITNLTVEPLVSHGKIALQRGTKFLKEAHNLDGRTKGAMTKVNELKMKVNIFQDRTHKLTKQLNDSLVMLGVMMPDGTWDAGLKTKELARVANVSALSILSDVVDFSQKLLHTSSELSRVNETLRKTTHTLSDSSKTTSLVEKKIKEVKTQTSLLFDRLKPLKKLEENLNRNLSEIKELINQARKQAASIKVAVSADRDCIRAYRPQISSTNYNTLMLNVKTTEPDNLLFYLGSSASSDFLAVEMRHGKVAFLWDVGSGTSRLEFSDFTIDNNKWHQIYITRFGNTGSLSIKEVSSTQKSLTKTAKSPGTANVLDVNESTIMFVGGLGGQIKKSSAVKVTHFKGCMGEAFLNGKSIGLWNYIEREGKCDGCFGSSQNEDSSFYFDGSGYSIVEKTLRSTVTQIIMLFSSFSPNSLLLYLTSNDTRDFLSIELVDGRIKLTVDLGSGPLVLITDRRYNNGIWYKISFQRNRKQGLLIVNDAYNTTSKETKQGESPGGSSDLNRLNKDPIYVGGLPRTKVLRKGITSRSYVGCIKSLEISRTTFDLLRNSYGVRKGCSLEPIRSASIFNEGYIELPPKPLLTESELMITFATKNNSGIILSGLNTGKEKRSRRQANVPFFSIMLIDGDLEIYINPGDGMSTRKATLSSTTGTYSDGQEHSVVLIRNKRTITVQVDEANQTEMRFGALAETKIINVSHLYIGGIPEDEVIYALRIRKSFYGCIKNLIFNMELLDFSTAVRYEQVDMDSCLLSERLQPLIHGEEVERQPEAHPLLSLEQCVVDREPDYVPNAHQFGLASGSHLILPFNQFAVRKRLSVQLSIRTFARSGLIYYMAHQNQIDYATLQLHEGQAYFMFDLGKGRAKASHPAFLSDGKWHTVKTEYVKRKGFITIDGQESAMVSTIGDGNTLDVEGKFYLGGLPLNYKAKNIGNITHGIPACIGEVMINSKQLDMNNSISAFSLKKCYTMTQEGTFFDGTGFVALVKEGYKVRSDVIITLEFRTSEMNGVLLGISSAKVDAIGIEIINGKVLFHVNNGAGRITAVYEPKSTNSLCDGKWHKLQAHKSKHRIILIVDGKSSSAESPHTQSTSADTNNPIYVGGYPADVKQNCLSSRTPFRGCMRKLTLTKTQQVESFDFSKGFDLQGVFPHSCPGNEN